jgi:Restriction endonuclease
MIDFNELPQDGTALEQLTRELLLVAGLSPQWTGRGPDQGRDLIAEETATGPLGSFRRRWLVQCKHFAHSARSVSRNDIPSVVDDCRQVNADGYLLVCSTYPSSGVAQKLSEISNDPSNAFSGPNQPPIPTQIGHPFQRKPATVPEHSGHPLPGG